MNLDIKTLMLLYVITNVISAGAVAVIWSQNRKRFAGLSFWLVDMILQAVGSALILLRGLVPNWVSMTLANAMIQAGALLIFIGLERFSGKRGRQIHNYVLLAAFIAVSTYYGLVQPDLRAREIALSATSMILTFQCCWLLLRRVDTGMRRITRLVGIVFAVYAAFSFTRICLHAIFPTQTSDFFKSGAVDALAITFYVVLSVCLAISLVLMVNRRLLADVKAQEEKFTTAFQSSPYAITLTRPSDGTIFEVNDGFVNLTGYRYGEVIGKTTLGLHLWVREEDRRAVTNELAQGREIHGVEYQFRKKTGEVLTGLFSANQVAINNETSILASISDISERKQMEEALRESETQYRKLIETMQDGVYKSSHEGKFLEVNSAMVKILGYDSKEELLAIDIKSQLYFAPEDRESAALEEKLEEMGVFRLRKKDGSEIWVEDHGRHVVNDEGTVLYHEGVLRDITERKRAEEKIKVSEIKYRVLFESLPLGVTVSDKAGHIQEANKEAERLLGLSQETQTQRSIDGQEWQIVRTDGSLMPADEYASVRALRENRVIENVEMGIEKGNGVITWINVTAAPISVPEYGVVIAYNDITDRKRAEEALQKNETLLNDVGEMARVGGWELDAETKQVFWTSETYRIHEIPEGERFDLTKALLFFDLPGRSTLEAALQCCMETGEGFDLELPFTSAKGRHLWTRAMGRAVKAGEKVIRLLGTFQDITDRKQLEERIRQVRSDLLFAVSHDLKSPLQTLRQTQEMLSQLPPAEALARFQEYGEIWRRNLQRLERMINNLVDSQRGEEGRFPLLLAPCDPAKMVRRVAEDLTGYALAPQVTFDLKLETVPQGSCDEETLARVVENLLTNAVKFSPQGGQVEVRLRMEGDTLLLEVEDHGLGIPALEQEQLFQPFQRGRSTQQKGIPGTGLGLYVCRRIVEEHGGTITLTSEEGEGAKVTVRLPWRVA